MEINVRELKAHLSEYLRKVEAGERVTVTSHGRAVAELVPPTSEAEQDDTWLLRQPWIRAGRAGAILGLIEPVQLRGGGPTLSDLLSADRE